MDFSKFKVIEQQYNELKEKLNHGDINPEDMKKELKKMMVLDEEGNYWMIGGKTGKWYIYNGTEWKENSPYPGPPPAAAASHDTEINVGHQRQENENTMVDANENQEKYEYQYEDQEPFSLNVTPGPLSTSTTETPETTETSETRAPISNENTNIDVTEEENEPTDIADAAEHTICKVCKAKISIYSVYCPVCGVNQKDAADPARKTERIVIKENELLLAAVKVSSLIFFLGGLGLIVGVLCGAAFGIFKNLIPEFQPLLPDMLSETRGGIAGGLIFAAVGGIAFFTLSAFTAAVLGMVYNIVSFIFGGIRFKIQQH